MDVDIEQDISDSVDGAPANEARTPREELGNWVSDIEKLLDGQFPDPNQTAGAILLENTNDSNPSICPNDPFPEKFKIGVQVYEYTRGNITSERDPMLKYVAYMRRWHGFCVESYLEGMKKEEKLARSYYEETNEWRLVSDSNCFLKSLMVGGCFLCFAILFFEEDGSFKKPKLEWDNARSFEFKILQQELTSPTTQTKSDMLNLGNQIPWFVVKAVFTNSDLCKTFNHIDRIAMSCFDDLYPRVNKCMVQSHHDDFKHLLHIFHWTRTPKELVGTSTVRFSQFYIPSATELLGSGTVIKKLHDYGYDTKYSNTQVSALMQISPLHLFSYSNKILTDLLKFEQKYIKCGLEVTAYIVCMQNLLQTKADVKLLQKNGIVRSNMNDEKEVLHFIHDFRKYLRDQSALVPYDLISRSEEVNRHHEKGLATQCAEFKSYFCPNRWVVVSIFGGIALFVLTIIQTIYTVLGYIKA